MKDLQVLIEQLKSEEFVIKGLQKAGRIVEREAKRKVPSVDGVLKMSIMHEVIGHTVNIGTNMPYAPYVEYGTGIHAVKGDGRKTPWAYIVRGAYADKYWSPDKKNCFMDEEGNKWIRTRGQKPQPYLEPALKENEKQILDLFTLEDNV